MRCSDRETKLQLLSLGLFLFLNHFVCVLLSFTNEILFLSFLPAEWSRRDGGAGETEQERYV